MQKKSILSFCILLVYSYLCSKSKDDMNQTPLVSFIITYYNLPVDMLHECIGSIMQLPLQSEEREIILIDDGSDITPLNEIIDYRDEVIYLRQHNQGLSTARNVGVDISKGRYIQFIDADDCLIKGGYEHCLSILRKESPDMVIFNFTREGTDVDTPYLFDGPVSGTEYMHHNNLRASACGYVFSRKTLGELRFTPQLLHEDEEFTPQLILRADTIYSTDTCAYYYRVRENSIVHNDDAQWKIKRLDDVEYVIMQLDHLANTLASSERIALQRRVAQLTMDYIYNIIMLTRSEQQLESRLTRLQKCGMFPLPARDYTQKYKWFRKMTNSKTGRKILMRVLPLLWKEK